MLNYPYLGIFALKCPDLTRSTLRFPWNSMDSTAISMEFSDSISMEVMANYAMASIECHGRGGILQNSMEVLKLDLVVN